MKNLLKSFGCALALVALMIVSADATTASSVVGASLTANAATVTAGVPITLTANPIGGSAPYQYKWWVYDGTAWSLAADWSPSGSFTWTPATAGSYYIGVFVKSASETDYFPYGAPYVVVAPQAGNTAPDAPSPQDDVLSFATNGPVTRMILRNQATGACRRLSIDLDAGSAEVPPIFHPVATTMPAGCWDNPWYW